METFSVHVFLCLKAILLDVPKIPQEHVKLCPPDVHVIVQLGALGLLLDRLVKTVNA